MGLSGQIHVPPALPSEKGSSLSTEICGWLGFGDLEKRLLPFPCR